MDAPTRDQIRSAARRLRLTLDETALRALEARLAAAADATARLAEIATDSDAPVTLFSPESDR